MRWPPPLSYSEERAVIAAYGSGIWRHGASTLRVEELMCEIAGAAHCVAFNSCTAALHAALAAHGAGRGAGVRCPTFTFAGTWAGAAHLACTPIWLDIRPDDLTVSLGLAHDLADYTLAVDLHGAPHRLDRTDPTMVTDACQSLGTLLPDGRHVGGQGTCCWSFSASKLVAAPSGGAVTCQDAELAHLLRCLRDYGTVGDGARAARTVVSGRGHNWAPAEPDMALVAHRLTGLKKLAALAHEVGEELRVHAREHGWRVQRPMTGSRVAWHKIRVGAFTPDHLLDLEHRLDDVGVGSHRWGMPLHMMPGYSPPTARHSLTFPIANRTAAMSLCLGTEQDPPWTWTPDEVRACKRALGARVTA